MLTSFFLQRFGKCFANLIKPTIATILNSTMRPRESIWSFANSFLPVNRLLPVNQGMRFLSVSHGMKQIKYLGGRVHFPRYSRRQRQYKHVK